MFVNQILVKIKIGGCINTQSATGCVIEKKKKKKKKKRKKKKKKEIKKDILLSIYMLSVW